MSDSIFDEHLPRSDRYVALLFCLHLISFQTHICTQLCIYICINIFVFLLANGCTQLQAPPGQPPESRVSTLGHDDWLQGSLLWGHPLCTTAVHPEHAVGLPYLSEEPGQ